MTIAKENTNISFLEANDFKSTKESRSLLLDKLNDKEKKMFKAFLKSVGI